MHRLTCKKKWIKICSLSSYCNIFRFDKTTTKKNHNNDAPNEKLSKRKFKRYRTSSYQYWMLFTIELIDENVMLYFFHLPGFSFLFLWLHTTLFRFLLFVRSFVRSSNNPIFSIWMHDSISITLFTPLFLSFWHPNAFYLQFFSVFQLRWYSSFHLFTGSFGYLHHKMRKGNWWKSWKISKMSTPIRSKHKYNTIFVYIHVKTDKT